LYLHKIMLSAPFAQKRLGNSLTWSAAYDGKVLTISHRSGRTYQHKVIAPVFIGVDISGGKPRVFPIKRPRDPRRALLWDYDFRKYSEVRKAPAYEDFEERYCFLPRKDYRDTLYYAKHFVYRSKTLFLGIVPEAVMYQGFHRAWWMSPDCTMEEVRKSLAGFARRYRNAARFALYQRKCISGKEGKK
jgi:hypothetical protein